MRAGCSLRPSPTRNRRGLVASIVVALLAAAWTGCTDSPSAPLRPTASPPPNPTTLTGITISDAEPMVVEGESATIVITLDSDPGTDIEVRFRRGRTGADDIAFTRDRVTWAAADWREPRRLTLTAVVDYFAERLEAHELHVWTYRRGQIGAGQQILPKETIQVWIAERRQLRALAGGGEGEIVLEWTEWGEQGIGRWQYRYRRFHELTWGAWADIPNSDVATRTLRVIGLSTDELYEFQVRPWRLEGAGPASNVARSYTVMVGSDGIPVAHPGFFLERGRRFRFYDSEFTFVVPHRMLLSTKQGGGQGGAVVAILFDETIGLLMAVEVETGEIVLETFWDAENNSYRAIYSRSGGIYNSWRGVPPPPGYDLAALWDEIAQSIRREPLP